MIPYIGCERARQLLEAFVDHELSVSDEVAVETHLRWCRTCTARVEDMRLIGAAIRVGSAIVDEDQRLSAVTEIVLARVRAEQEESLGTRLRQMFGDMRLFWPAIGATAAVIVAAAVALGVLQRASAERPESLAAMIEWLAQPGSERNPIWADGVAPYDYAVRTGRPFDNMARDAISLPRVLDDGSALLGRIPEEDAVFALATVVNREGRVANFELLEAVESGSAVTNHPAHVAAVLDAVRQSRFQPAQEHRGVFGRTVAVNMVWVIVHQTVKGSAQTPTRGGRSRQPAAVKPECVEPTEEPAGGELPAAQDSATA
jgi:hypothetical protein